MLHPTRPCLCFAWSDSMVTCNHRINAYDKHSDYSCILQVVDFRVIHAWLLGAFIALLYSPVHAADGKNRRGAWCSHLVTVQLQIDVPFVGVEADVALLLHILVAHGVVCNGVCAGGTKGWVDYAWVHDKKECDDGSGKDGAAHLLRGRWQVPWLWRWRRPTLCLWSSEPGEHGQQKNHSVNKDILFFPWSVCIIAMLFQGTWRLSLTMKYAVQISCSSKKVIFASSVLLVFMYMSCI